MRKLKRSVAHALLSDVPHLNKARYKGITRVASVFAANWRDTINEYLKELMNPKKGKSHARVHA